MMSLADALSAVKRQQRQINYLYMRAYIAEEFPNMSKALKLIDIETTKARHPKGFNLMKRENKALGFVYYVRYYHEKRMISSKWCTHTNDYAEACEFAIKHRNKLIKKYLETNDNEVDKFFKNYYDAQTTIYKIETARNGELSEI